MSVSLFPVPAVDFGLFEVSRVASPAEMAAAGGACVDCGTVLVTKLGGRPVAGAMLGRRESVSDEWTFRGPLCHPCDEALGSAA